MNKIILSFIFGAIVLAVSIYSFHATENNNVLDKSIWTIITNEKEVFDKYNGFEGYDVIYNEETMSEGSDGTGVVETLSISGVMK